MSDSPSYREAELSAWDVGAANSGSRLSDLPDEQLVEMARDGDDSAFEVLIGRYKASIIAKARNYFLRGADKEDVIQEGMIGLVKAIRDYRSDRVAAFKSFAELCITRQIITAIKTATRQKHIPLNSYISLYKTDNGNEERMLIDQLESDSMCNPEEYIILNESYKAIDEKLLKLLSSFECKVLEYYITGKSYAEIARLINKPIKSIDNALQRIKRKLEKCSGIK